ncbi:MAG: GNAT family N-acetyltransferase [Erysipelotrichaceae bacterium]|nr:GNAT family N-acetyltransferase [Erysipelotrichaceae bacterium]
MISVKAYEELTRDELYRMMRARQDVFVVEQNCVYPDIDDTDLRSTFVLLEENGRHLASLRMFDKDEEKRIMQIGRVLTTVRGKGYGALVLHEGIETAKQKGASKIYIEAQTYAIGFYEREGFRVASDEFLEDGIPHVCMELELRQ